MKNGNYLELKSLYMACYISCILSAVYILLVKMLIFTEHLQLGVFYAGLIAGLAIGLLIFFTVKRKADIAKMLKRAAAVTDDEVTAGLWNFRDRLRRYTGNNESDIKLMHGNAVVAWTAKSREKPLVFISTGFLLKYTQKGTENESDVVLAHEAGHINAGDVEFFHAMMNVIKTILIFLLLSLVLDPVFLFAAKNPGAVKYYAYIIAIPLFSLLFLFSSWSALLNARELHSDAFAADCVGQGRVEEYFLKTVNVAAKELFIRKIIRMAIQPASKWRRKIPALENRTGAKIEIFSGGIIVGLFLQAVFIALINEGLLENTKLSIFSFFGYIIPLSAGFIAFIISYVFLWHRNYSLRNDKYSLAKKLFVCAKFSIIGLSVWVIALVLLRRVTEYALHPAFLFLLICIPVMVTLLTWSLSNFGLSFDLLRRRDNPRPRVLSCILSIISFACAFILFTTICFLFVDIENGAHYEPLAAIISVSSIVSIAHLVLVSQLILKGRSKGNETQ